MRYSWGRMVVAVAVAILVAAAGTAKAEDIKVGVLLPLTGQLANFGEMEKRSFEMAAEEINAAGGVRGSRIRLFFEDDTGRPEIGRSAVEKLISRDKVSVISGGYSSAVTIAASAVAQQRKVPFLISSAAADDITEKGYEYIFRINPSSSEYPLGVISFLKNVAKDVKTAAIIYENTLFGQSSSKDIEGYCRQLGIQVVLKNGFEAGAVDFMPLLVNVKQKNPDMVYMTAYVMDASLLMRQFKEIDFSPKIFVGGGGGFTMPEFAASAGPAAENVFSVSLWMENVSYPGARKYYDNYLKKYKSPTAFQGAEAYGSMYVIADAIKRARSMTPNDVRDALAKTDMMTAFGPVKFIAYDHRSQQNKLPTFLIQWQKGKAETVWPLNLATKKYIYPSPKWIKR